MLLSIKLIGQNPDIKRTWHWYFGAGAGLDFSSGYPVADTSGRLHSYESCAVMSDTAGNLLFYTDGDTVWDKNHQVILNGTGLLGCGNYNNSSTQGAVIVPYPKNDSLFYIFTSDCFENQGINGYRYHIVDIKNNIVISKNNYLYAPSTEGMCVVKHFNNIDYFLITHEFMSNNFRVYKIDDTLGLIHTPIISSIGQKITDYIIAIKVSPNGKKLAIASQNTTANQIFDFDNKTGKINKVINLGVRDSLLPQGISYYVEFSPDNSKIYYMVNGNYIYQYCLSEDGDSTQITQTFNIIAYVDDNSMFGQLQLDPIGGIIIAAQYHDSISYIRTPNEYGNKSNIQIKKLPLKKLSLLGLPNFISNYFIDSKNTSLHCDANNNIEINVRFLYIPNIFTPNGDDVNDYFIIQLAGYKHIAYTIYNRWGMLIRQGKREIEPESNKEIKLWDGTYEGYKVSSGIYYYRIVLTKMNDEQEIKTGYIQVMY